MQRPAAAEGPNLFVRGWGDYPMAGDSNYRIGENDRHAVRRLELLLLKLRGRSFRADELHRWIEAWLRGVGPLEFTFSIRDRKAA